MENQEDLREIWLNKNKLKGQFKERYPEYANKEITVKIYPYSLEFLCDNKRVYEEKANKGSRYIDRTEEEEAYEKEQAEYEKRKANELDKIRLNNSILRRENARLMAELEALKKENENLKNKIDLLKTPTKNKSKRGRPEIKAKDLHLLKDYLEMGLSEEDIKNMLGVSTATFYRYKRVLKQAQN